MSKAPTSRTKHAGSETGNSTDSYKLRRIVAAPPPSHPGLYATVLNVECAEDEDVEWLWTETSDGRFVSAYRLVPRITGRSH
jgi:hypothetical protein